MSGEPAEQFRGFFEGNPKVEQVTTAIGVTGPPTVTVYNSFEAAGGIARAEGSTRSVDGPVQGVNKDEPVPVDERPASSTGCSSSHPTRPWGPLRCKT